jgi:hypothetical protein
MARNQPNDFSDDDDPSYRESGLHSGSSTPSPATYSTSSPSTPAAQGTLGANGLSSSDMDLHGMGEGIGDASTQSSPYQGIEPSRPSPAQEAARAAQKTATKNRSSTSSSSDPSPISMAKKRRNQPG